ncbi:hypothetical protein L1987_11209 [Smallanthus sonchifolius]|uniref:Uncharacterized protein n=1 Tax=Smallanthus sonchifolius TaxID=185202 RepID=A0ACB9JA97_9ASTR|nr:hypothetical protein L1987_11209 [Smallanthus sonchifolius]
MKFCDDPEYQTLIQKHVTKQLKKTQTTKSNIQSHSYSTTVGVRHGKHSMITLEIICNVIFCVIAGAVAICFTIYAKKALKGLENEDNKETDDVSDSVPNKLDISMASSSSSSHCVPASISQSWNYDVFLSFRGEDTRKRFVDHLYTALVQQGIHTYKDDETLARGESIGPSLLKAIQESRIAVVVFSKNYADSSWCLDELACIIDCMDNIGQVVMPIFYDIDPSDVRKQNGKYGEAFDKHRWENKHKVESWRKALVKTSNLSGWVPRDFANGHEANCIKNIVGTISGRLSPLITNVDTDLIGIETHLLDLKSKLVIGSGGVRMVGIWGVGGGGKTTLASAAYTEISHEFDAHCLLENIRDESSKHGLKKLQEKILSVVLKTKVKLLNEREGKSMIKSRLCHKSVLVVLDDVDDLKQLEALAGSHDWFGDGSRIIITTRDEHLLSRKADAIYEVSLLSHDEAIKLFGRHAYREDKPVEDYEMLSLDVVSYAGGLPLALEILGTFLYDKDKDEWMSALAKLKCIPHVKVTERLKISYDGLEPDEKELFLDIACFLRRWPIDRAIRVLDACSFHPGIGVKVLVQKSLIKVSNGILDMHDLVEEMAHYIVRGEHPSHPEKHSRIWQEKDIVEFCAMGAETLMENYHIEVLALPSYIIDLSLPRFGAIKSRKFPKFSLPSYVSHPRLPDVVANMKKLRWIYWEGYPASSLPTEFQPTKLSCLMLIRGQQNQLWEGCKHLPNLKTIDLQGNFHLLKRLKDLNLSGCNELEKLAEDFFDKECCLEVNAVEDRFMSVQLPPELLVTSAYSHTMTLIRLQLPHNWYSDFSGFLLCADNDPWEPCIIVLKQEMSMDSQPSHCEEFNKNCESYDQYERVGYVPFGSLRHTSWWNPTYTNISVEIHDVVNPKVVFVRRNGKTGNSRERSIDYSECWDKEWEDRKTFEVIDDPKSSKIEIVWSYDSYEL